MFSFFKNDPNIYAPIAGECLDITECNDKAFAEKTLGDGFIVIPQECTVKSPCDGLITMIFPTKHAIGITMSSGQEIILHVGIDTVKLNGKKFTVLVRVGAKVKAGTPLIKFDAHYMKEHQIDMSVIVALVNWSKFHYTKKHLNEIVKSDTCVLEMKGS
jgi:sugar PTS system EIIA component